MIATLFFKIVLDEFAELNQTNFLHNMILTLAFSHFSLEHKLERKASAILTFVPICDLKFISFINQHCLFTNQLFYLQRT